MKLKGINKNLRANDLTNFSIVGQLNQFYKGVNGCGVKDHLGPIGVSSDHVR
jgi:hypothetical protein